MFSHVSISIRVIVLKWFIEAKNLVTCLAMKQESKESCKWYELTRLLMVQFSSFEFITVFVLFINTTLLVN